MAFRIVIIDGAKEEFKDIKKYLKTQFGGNVWAEVNLEYKECIKKIKSNPHAGNNIDALKDIGITNIKYSLVRQTRVVYEFDDELIVIHMFISTKRDFKSHLMKRLFS